MVRLGDESGDHRNADPHGVERRLAAILSADVKDYSRLMGDDEVATVRTLTVYREMIAAIITGHRGRVVDAPGDNLLAEFPSVVHAVQCAAEVQRTLRQKNTDLPATRVMEFRIGINLGDVIIEGDRLYGDGVNIAARLEGLAEAGGICISGSAFDQVEGKLALQFEFLGEQTVKNIAKPVRVYRVHERTGSVAANEATRERPRWRRRPSAVLVTVFLAGVIGTGAWYFFLRPPAPPPLALPNQPSIAVLPFDNLSADTGQEHIADGMTEDLITALSKISGLVVIARASVSTYKDRPVTVQQVSRELGVRYVLEGSVRTAGDRVRITAQLIEATTGHHLWAERYDRPLNDIFVLQDEITQKIVTAMQVRLTEGEQARVWRRSTTSVEAWTVAGQALEHLRLFTREGNVRARELAERALVLDPKFAAASVILAWTHLTDARIGWSDAPERSMERARALAQKALAMDPSLADTHALLASIHLNQREHDQAVAAAERAVALNPNGAEVTAVCADTLTYAGRPADAIGLVKKAMRLSPFYPAWYLGVLGHAYLLTGRHDEAIDAYRKDIERRPDGVWSRVGVAIVYAQLGRETDARDQVAEVLRIDPRYSIQRWEQASPYRDRAEVERGIDALRRSGLR